MLGQRLTGAESPVMQALSTRVVAACEQHAQAADYWRTRAAEGEARHAYLVKIFYILTLLTNPRLAVP